MQSGINLLWMELPVNSEKSVRFKQHPSIIEHTIQGNYQFVAGMFTNIYSLVNIIVSMSDELKHVSHLFEVSLEMNRFGSSNFMFLFFQPFIDSLPLSD